MTTTGEIDETTAAMELAYLEGATMQQIGARFGVSKQAVWKRLLPALASGRIPRDTRAAQSGRISAARMRDDPGVAARVAAGKDAHLRAQGYTEVFRRIVAQAALEHGVRAAAREWGVGESTTRRWRDAAGFSSLAGPE